MPLIKVHGLTKLYRMGDTIVRALDGVDLAIERGEFVAITGASGSGKSTMMHLLGCLDRPTAGTFHFDGRDVGNLSDGELAAVRNLQIGFVFQTFNLINRTTALENVGVPLFYARRLNIRTPALRALERVGLEQRATHRPNELSGGERQRVAIARAIVNDPPLLLADEPTGNLDSRTGAQIMTIFNELNAQGVTVVMVTHEPDVAERARRVVHMKDGKIVSDEPVSQWRARHGRVGPLAAFAERESTDEEDGVGAVAAPQAVDEPALLGPARVIPGAHAACWLGVLGLVCLGGALLATIVLATLFGARDPAAGPPAVSAGRGVAALAGLLGIVFGVFAIALGRGALQRLRTEPGNWIGGGRARAGVVLGLIVVGLPVAGIVISIAMIMLKESSAGG